MIFEVIRRIVSRQGMVMALVSLAMSTLVAAAEDEVTANKLSLDDPAIAPAEDGFMKPIDLTNPDEKVELSDEAKLQARATLRENLLSSVDGLADPREWKSAVKIPIQIRTKNRLARIYTRQGFGLLQSAWDIEAHRSFVFAIKNDKDCLGSYTGLLILSAQQQNPSHQFRGALVAVVDELRSRLDGTKSYYGLQERLYASVALDMALHDKRSLEIHMEELVKNFPLDFQAAVMYQVVLQIRQGSDDAKLKAEFVARMMKNYPLVPLLWVYWLSVHHFETDKAYLEKEVQPVAKNLVQWDPEMPTWHLYQGIVQMKIDQFDEAAASFEQALKRYTSWGKESKLPEDANGSLWVTRVYQILTTYHAGDFDEAMRMAKQLQKVKVNLQLRSEVRGVYLWEVQTLPARMYLARGKQGDLELAKESLPKKDFIERILKLKIEGITAAAMYYAGFYEYIGFRMEVAKGNLKGAEEIYIEMGKTSLNFDDAEKAATGFIDRNYFYRGRLAFIVYNNHANRELARMKGNKKEVERFSKSMHEVLNKKVRLSRLPRHVLETYNKAELITD